MRLANRFSVFRNVFLAKLFEVAFNEHLENANGWLFLPTLVHGFGQIDIVITVKAIALFLDQRTTESFAKKGFRIGKVTTKKSW